MKYVVLTLSGAYRETVAAETVGLSSRRASEFRFDTFHVTVARILTARRVTRVLVDCRPSFASNLFGGLEAVREELLRLTAAGMETWFFAPSYDVSRLYLASACRHRVMHPLGRFSFLGAFRPFLFFKDALERYNVEPTVLRRGAFKSAGDRFRTRKLDAANREQYQTYFDHVMDEAVAQITQALGKSVEDLQELRAGSILGAQEALAAGWVDDVMSLTTLQERWRDEHGREQRIKVRRHRYGRGGKTIAVLVFDGSIVDGESRWTPLLGTSVGDRTFVKHIRALTKNRTVKGVVLRVNSRGGSATASEEILTALEALRARKPLVVSLSDVAGSGGYWIALAGQRIFSHRTTLTGSIGVITMLFSIRKLLKRMGVTTDSITTDPHADLGSFLRNPSKAEKNMLQRAVDDLYGAFVARVAQARGTSSDEIETVARGRVWSGRDAMERGLVDETGNLSHALAYIQGTLGLKRARVTFYPQTKVPFLLRLLGLRRGGDAAGSARAIAMYRSEMPNGPLAFTDGFLRADDLPRVQDWIPPRG